MEFTYYVTPSKMAGRFDLRQARFRAQLQSGTEHRHDLMAVAFEAKDMRDLIAKHFPNTDTSALPAA